MDLRRRRRSTRKPWRRWRSSAMRPRGKKLRPTGPGAWSNTSTGRSTTPSCGLSHERRRKKGRSRRAPLVAAVFSCGSGRLGRSRIHCRPVVAYVPDSSGRSGRPRSRCRRDRAVCVRQQRPLGSSRAPVVAPGAGEEAPHPGEQVPGRQRPAGRLGCAPGLGGLEGRRKQKKDQQKDGERLGTDEA